jgi:hypothetical protein
MLVVGTGRNVPFLEYCIGDILGLIDDNLKPPH